MKTSKALLEVWDMKDAAYKETMHLKGSSYFSYIRNQIAKSFSGIDSLPRIVFAAPAKICSPKTNGRHII